jgi:Fur family transcriptional regulator, ferric uptake regulator
MVTPILEHLASEGYPLTEQRRTIVELVMAQRKRFTADDLLAELQRQELPLGRATVFRTLDLLAQLGYIGRVREGRHLSYTVCHPGHHHHLVCLHCGQVLHIDGCPVSKYLAEIEATTGFLVAEHNLEIAGVCPACRATGTFPQR